MSSRVMTLEHLERRSKRNSQRLVVRDELARHVEVREVPSLRSWSETDMERAGRVLTVTVVLHESGVLASLAPP